MNKKFNQISPLLIIIFIALLVRLILLWLARPEFVGWFNHTYYYYVETRGLLENGELPYPDMPLLFYVYAFTAGLLEVIGFESGKSILFATRFWMIILPSLIPWPVYLMLRNIAGNRRWNIEHWLLVGVSGFMPLTIMYMPEFSQKNVAGLLLIAWLLFYIQKALNVVNLKHVAICLILTIMITLTHFGSAIVVFLLLIALLVAYFGYLRRAGSIFIPLLTVLLLTVGSTLLIYIFDNDRLQRIVYYFLNSLEYSFLSQIYAPGLPLFERVISISIIAMPVLLLAILLRNFRRSSHRCTREHNFFYLTLIIFSYLLVLPVYDTLVLARFVLYLPLPVLIILICYFDRSAIKMWQRKLVALVVCLGAGLMVIGEGVSSFLHSPDKDLVYLDLVDAYRIMEFRSSDLILTRNGVEHVCNWFLGAKAGVITSFNKNDFRKYERIFILNPLNEPRPCADPGSPEMQGRKGRYQYMLCDIRIPEEAAEAYRSDFMEIYQINGAPDFWEYDEEGVWRSYNRQE